MPWYCTHDTRLEMFNKTKQSNNIVYNHEEVGDNWNVELSVAEEPFLLRRRIQDRGLYDGKNGMYEVQLCL